MIFMYRLIHRCLTFISNRIILAEMSGKSPTRITNKCRHGEKYIRGEMCHVIHCYPKA